MSKMRRLLAAVLVASMILGSNGIAYAAEAAGADDTVSTVEVTEEAAEKESNPAADAELPDETEEAAAPGDSDEAVEASQDDSSEAIEAEEASEQSAPEEASVEDASSEDSADEEDAAAEETEEDISEDEDAIAEESTDAASAEESADEASVEESDEASVEESDEAASTEESDEAASAEDASEAAPAEETSEEEMPEAVPAEAATEEAAAQATTQEAAQEVFTAGELVYHGKDFDVTMAYDEKAEIPADAKLKVREIMKGTSEYDAYMSGAQAASDKGVAEARFFDITIWAKDKEIQPKSAVRVNISYKKAIDVADEGEVKAMHFEDGTQDPDVLDTDTNGGSKVDEIAFDAESFSVYGVIYTVDFTYDGYTFSMPGEGSILLSDLADELGLYEKDLDKAFSVDNVSDVTFTDYDLIKIEKQADGDWLLTSLASFTSEEILTITMADGTKFVIVVTDPPEETDGTQTSSDLTNFLTSVLITGATQNSEGRYEVEQGKEYTLIANFLENADYQFQNDADLTYQMPEGIKVLNEQRGPLKINIVYKGKTYEVDASYVLTTDGKLTIKFDESDPEYPKLVSSTNVGFRFSYRAEFDGSATEIHFSDDVERDIVFNEPEPGQAFANKSAVYDETTGTFNYTIKVNATGDVTNVNVRDVITGDALIFNNDVRVTGNSSDYTDNGAANGFDYTFASMREGEEITITYSAKVNFAKDTDKDGKINADQTKNTVTVEPEDGEPHKSDYSHEIVFNTAKKSEKGTEEGTTENGDKIIGWTINYNPLALASAAGYTITDTIAAGSAEYMKYYGNGITVDRYDHDGNFVDSYQVPYTSMTSHSDSSWTYTIPDDHTEPYRYVITYQTVVDMEKVDGAGSAVHLENTANGSQGAVDVTPGNQVGITKQVVQSSTQEISWVSEIHIPDGGLDVAVVTDTLPTIWSTNIGKSGGYSLYDLLKGNVEITGLIEDESYILDTSSEDKVVITFFKDKNKITPGLTGVEGGHTITVRLTTTVNQEWLEAGYNYPTSYQSYHENKIDINGTTATAGVRFLEEDMVKTASALGNGVFKYTLKLSNVSESPIIIDDVFDTGLLEVDLSKESADWNKEVFYITGGSDVDHIYSGEKSEKVNYSETESGIKITANTVPMQEDGQYYPAYMITYFLKLKDGVDLEQLAIANGGKHELTNTANWNGHESSYTYETVYDYLDKKLLNAGELGGTNREARYQITFNSSKAVLNGGEPMEMTDTLSANLSVDYSSITIVTDPQGVSVPYSFKGGDEGTTIATYTVPDATAVTITYRASVAGNGTQKIVNKVKVKNDEETEENSSDYGSAGEGEGAIAAFKIVKVDGYDANKKLSGVKFKLYPGRSGIYFDDDNTVSELFYTTDENGEIIIDGDATIDDGDPTTEDKKIKIFFNQLYYLKEVEGPENYEKIAFPYNITLTNDMSLVDYEHYIYYYSDTMQIKNWPLEGVIVEKQVESTEAADLERRYNFKISILDENDEVDTSISEKIGDDDFVDGVTYFDLKTGEQKMFWGFAKGTRYKVEEIDADGFATTVTYSVYDVDGNVTEVMTEATSEHTGELTQEDETIVFTNKKTSYGSLKIKKNVTVNGEATTGTAADGTYEFTILDSEGNPAKGKVNGTEITDGKVTITITNGAASTVEVTGLEPGNYTITETTPTKAGVTLSKAEGGIGVSPAKVITVKVTSGKEGTEVLDSGIGTFTNDYNATGTAELEAVKEVSGADWPSGATATFTVTAAEGTPMPENTSVTLTEAGTATFGPINYTEAHAGKTYEYTITESGSNFPNGWSASPTKITATVAVTDKGDGTLETTVTYDPSNKKITNKYKAEGEAELEAVKEVSGADWPSGATATFTVTATEGTPMPENTSVTLTEAGTATFGPIDYTEAHAGKTYEYTITESGSNFPNGWSASPTKITATVVVGADKGDGTLEDAVVTYSPENATITNSYAAEGEAELQATKAIEGAEWPEGATATFTVTAADGTPMPEQTEVVLTAAGTADFGEIKYTLEDAGKTYTYTITETGEGFGSGWSANPTEITATVIVGADKGDGTLEPSSVTYSPENQTITNKYEAEGKGELEATKAVEGAEWPEGAKATFTVTAADGTPMPEETEVVLTAAGTADFGEIKYTLEDAGKTYTYMITETGEGFGSGWSANPTEITATVVVGADKGDGTLEDAVVTYSPENATITNKYEAEGEAELEAIKAVSGAEWPEGAKATFTVTAADGTPMPEETEVVLTAAGTADFGKIKYTLEDAGKTYTYTITETGEGFGSGWSANPTEITATVVVGEDKGDGTLEDAVVTYDPENATITNKYEAEGEAELEAVKAVEGAEWPEGATATFTVTAADGTPVPEETEVVLTAAGTAEFGKIKYTLEDAGKTYIYTITETGEGFGGGWSANPAEITATVVVGEDKGDGTLEDAVVTYDPENATITNKYEAEGEAELEAVKAVEGAEWPEGATATFTVTAADGTPMPEETEVVLTAAGTADFGKILYNETHADKTFEYTITESGNWGAGWTSNSTITATVEVTDKGNGELDTKVTYTPEDKTITNTYTAEGKAKIQVTKAVSGAPWPEGATATFALEAVTEGAPMPGTTSVPLTAAGIADFGEITYGKSDAGKTYVYKITETETGFGDGWSADPEEITVTVKVGKDKGDGTLEDSEVTYDPATGTITNIYETKGDITFSGTKKLENRKLKEGEFTFELYEVDGGNETLKETVSNAADGSYSFSKIEYTGEDLNTEDGHYVETTKRYKVVEKKGDDSSVTYDETEYEITVALTDDGEGHIEVTAEPAKNTYDFTNTYNTKGDITFSGTKKLENRKLKAGEFSFELYEVDGGNETLKETVSNAADGSYSFSKIEYTGEDLGKDAEGNYNKTATKSYKVVEKTGTLGGVTYDKTEYEITVTLTDDGKGHIAVTADPKEDSYNFKNTYETEGSITFSGTKKLENRKLKEGEFSFELYEVDGGNETLKETVSNAADGSYSFSEIKYTGNDLGKDAEGNYNKTATKTYKVVEKNGGQSINGVAHAVIEYEIEVTLTDDGMGHIDAETIPDPDTYDFTNTYNTVGIITFEGKKTLENRKLEEDEFSFELYEVDGENETLKETVSNAADGSYSFSEISYTGEDLGRDAEGNYNKTATKTYKVVEKDGGKKIDGVNYDVTAYEIEVTLTDDGIGHIDVEANPAENTYDFTNTYETEGSITFSGTKTLENRKLEEGEFSFELYEVDGENETLKETVSNAADGSYSFSEISYTGEDLGRDEEGNFNETATKTYKVKEKAGADASVTYDGKVYEITVTLTDDRKGHIDVTADPAEDTYDFTNTYNAKGEIVIEAGKFLEGRPLEKDRFKFDLVETLADGTEKTVETVSNSNDGSITFSSIEYTQDDMDKDADGNLADTVKTYTIKEQKEDAAGYTYSEEVYTVNVTLHDDRKGTIETTKDKEPEDLVFTNGYKADGQIVLTAEKKLVGKDKLEAGQFSFELKDVDGNVLQTKSNKADGSVTFDAIKYTQDDIYEVDPETGVYSGADTKTLTYTISEVIPEGAKDNGDGTFLYNGYTYDGTVYTVKVVATDNGDGTITAQIAEAEGSEAVFTNAYAADGILKLDAEKTFKNGTLKGNDFTFELKDADGNVLQSKKNDAAGNVSFDLITYEMADAARSPITYTVNEVAGSRTDVKYDETVYTVTVTLEDNGDGTLKVTRKIDNGGKLKFVNELKKDAETSITLGGVKVLQGQKLQSGMFSFVLKGQDGKWIESTTNDANGNFTFGKITYKQADLKGETKKVYKYKISEVKGSKSGIIYDTSVYTVIVTVTDNGDGTMIAQADMTRNDIKFVNKTETKKKKKRKDSTRTGDEAPLGVLFGGLGIGAVGLAVLLEDRRRRGTKK